MRVPRSPVERFRAAVTLAQAAQVLWFAVIFVFSLFSGLGCAVGLLALVLALAYPLAWVFVACPRCREPIGSSVQTWHLSSPRTFFGLNGHKPPKDLTCVRCGAPLGEQRDGS